MTQGRVLILDGHFMSALAIARSLGRRGIEVVLAGPEAAPLARYSRQVARYHRYPDPSTDLAGFVAALERLIGLERPDLVIPVTEKTLIPLSERRATLEGLTRIALPPEDALATALDKQATTLLARELGIRVPGSISVADTESLCAAADTLGLPVVLKPIRSVSRVAGALGPQLTVAYAFDRDELLRVAAPLLQHGDVVVQEYFRGEGGGVEIIADRGRLLYAFQHQRLHELPLSGGGSCLRQAVAVDPQLLAATERMVAALRWHGVAMFEFKCAADGSYRLIEINGRFWGSLPLSVAAGADFPWYAWQLYTGGALAPPAPYRPGVLCRDLAKDLYWHEYVLRRVTDPRLFAYPARGRLGRDLALFFSPRHHLDSWRWNDPLPGILELGRLGRHYGARLGDQWQRRLDLGRQRSAWRRGELPRRLQSAGNLLILCYGNINRSAAAHAYLEQRLAGSAALRIASAGFHPQEGRCADPTMVAVAAQRGVDLTPWRSRRVTRAMLDDADLVLVMELRHKAQVAQLSPAAAQRCYLWGAALADSDAQPEIADPYGQAPAEYQRCFERLTTAADRILALDGPWRRVATPPETPTSAGSPSGRAVTEKEVIDAKCR